MNWARLSAGAQAAPSPRQAEAEGLSALRYKKIIKQNAQAYGVPWQVVAGVLESEMQLDTGWDDPIEDAFLMEYSYLSDMGWLPLVGRYLSNPGVSVGNVHILTARATADYFATNYPSSASLQLGIQPSESNLNVFRKLWGLPFSIRAMTANIRGLADFRFGSGGEASFVSHANLSEWTIVDAVAVWHGYRYGIHDAPISPGGDGFKKVEDFQDRSLNLDEFINQKVTGAKGDPKKSARDSEKYFQAYWSMPD